MPRFLLLTVLTALQVSAAWGRYLGDSVEGRIVGGGAARYDIALLRLSSEFYLGTYVKLGTLPPFEQVLPHNNLCYLSGWGLTSTNGVQSPVMKEAALPIVGHETCTSSGWWGSTIKTTMICAGGAADSGCNGDFGGPLSCVVDGQYVVHGVASFVSGMGCNTPKKPTVFTRVSAFIPWINSFLGCWAVEASDSEKENTRLA
ncbi:hypothetical protein NHX12_030425 [Muraenolepis orangiensis]|uniref:Peptidase S1 domain-containing protein n=1 Tax=Muraenolepis orangiensis TaxID=630683 RepID=A0A9Q0E9H1_9TELE|nr:hypothetical protein NHX12_030425 [Muraenolepis orangiensis]